MREPRMNLPPACLALWLALVLAGCRTAPPLPPANLAAPGWQMQQGQAIWKANFNRPELAGDLLVASNAHGEMLVQFIKEPFPLVNAQTTAKQWQIDFAAGRRSWRGHGKPSRWFLWFHIPAALRDEPLPRPWRFSRKADSWRLENSRRGEWLEGRFYQ